MIEVVGRLPVNTRAGTIASAVPSAAHLVGGLAEREGLGLGEEVRQEQLVHVGARRLGVLSGYAGLANAMKSAGISRVPWWISW